MFTSLISSPNVLTLACQGVVLLGLARLAYGGAAQ